MYINNPRWAMRLTPTTHFCKEPGGVSISGGQYGAECWSCWGMAFSYVHMCALVVFLLKFKSLQFSNKRYKVFKIYYSILQCKIWTLKMKLMNSFCRLFKGFYLICPARVGSPNVLSLVSDITARWLGIHTLFTLCCCLMF